MEDVLTQRGLGKLLAWYSTATRAEAMSDQLKEVQRQPS